jgi:hypothetical protein
MKKKIFVFILAGLMLSCSKDNDDDAVDVSGSYRLTAFNTSVPTDLNGDGTTSTNQMTETDCFNNSILTLSPNNTYTTLEKGVEINLDGINSTIECYDDGSSSGTWSFDGNNKVTVVDGQEIYDLIIDGNNLRLKLLSTEVVGVDQNGDPVTLNSDIEFVYTKQ